MPLNLQDVWLHIATDLGTYLNFPVTAIKEVVGMEGQRQRRADGRFVAIVTPGIHRDISLTVDRMSRANFDILRKNFLGKKLLYRDPRGRATYCTIYNVNGQESGFSDEMVEIEFSLLEIGSQPVNL